jgi:hypothetical protein
MRAQRLFPEAMPPTRPTINGRRDTGSSGQVLQFERTGVGRGTAWRQSLAGVTARSQKTGEGAIQVRGARRSRRAAAPKGSSGGNLPRDFRPREEGWKR